MGEVVGKGFLVENTGAHQRAILPSSKCAADSWDGGEVLADADALLFSLKLILKHDIWFVATALGAGNLCIQIKSNYWKISSFLKSEYLVTGKSRSRGTML